MLQIAGIGQHQAVLHPAVGQRHHFLLCQLFHQLLGGYAQRVHLNHRLGGIVVGRQHRLQIFFPHIATEQIDQDLRMAVPVLQGGGLLQCSLCADGIAKHCVDQPRRTALPPAIFFCQQNGLVHRRVVGDLIQLIDLIKTHVQNVTDKGMQILQLSGQQLLQEKVQHTSVLQNTVAQAGSQGRIPAVQPVTPDIIFQNTVGPGCLLPAGDQGIQSGLSCVHNHPSQGKIMSI